MTATNPTDAAVTLSRIDLRTVGPGAYVLRTPAQPMNLRVAAKSSASLVITARGSAAGGHIASEEPVTVRATAYFDGPDGAFVRVVNETFSPRAATHRSTITANAAKRSSSIARWADSSGRSDSGEATIIAWAVIRNCSPASSSSSC